jgi:hypothetical protein
MSTKVALPEAERDPGRIAQHTCQHTKAFFRQITGDTDACCVVARINRCKRNKTVSQLNNQGPRCTWLTLTAPRRSGDHWALKLDDKGMDLIAACHITHTVPMPHGSMITQFPTSPPLGSPSDHRVKLSAVARLPSSGPAVKAHWDSNMASESAMSAPRTFIHSPLTTKARLLGHLVYGLFCS